MLGAAARTRTHAAARPPRANKEVRTMTRLDRRRFLEVASATGVAAAVSPGAALARGLDERKPTLLGVHADNGARVVAQHVLDPRTVDITIDSTALGHTASARILLPNRFASHSDGAWPVLYLLHGGLGSYVDWTESSGIADLARERDVLVVMPDGGSLGFYTDWWDRGAGKQAGLGDVPSRRALADPRAWAQRLRPARCRRSLDGRLRGDVVRRSQARILPSRSLVQRGAEHPPSHRRTAVPRAVCDLAVADVRRAARLRPARALRRSNGAARRVGGAQSGRSRGEPARHEAVRVLRQRARRPARSAGDRSVRAPRPTRGRPLSAEPGVHCTRREPRARPHCRPLRRRHPHVAVLGA